MVSDPSSPEQVVADDAYTPRQIKDAALELLKFGLLEAASKPNLYRTATAQRADIARVLEPLDLTLKIDELRGLAYLVVVPSASESTDDEWSHPLVRRQRMNLEQSLLVAILRQQFVAHEQEAGVGSAEALVSVEDILPQVQTYLGSLGSDALEQKRLRNLLEQLKGYGLVSEVDRNDQFHIRPIIAHLANPENLTSLLHAYRNAASRRGAGEGLAQDDGA
ncbi:MAG TPA: DUF4194 domain-containing protein [Candidatus Paceibacterota bacterium]|jgi:hypothetical protein|nr:DUF4194 domain-containing protein [Candidatus Paceibacterota bacterium]